jgi:DNA-binding NtrC family response regulator
VSAERTQVTRTLQRGGATLRLLRVCAVEVRSGPSAGVRATIDHPVFRVGAHASNDLVIDDPAVSQHHLEIRLEPDGYRLVDLDSSNGTFSGDLRVRDALTVDPIVLALGTSTLALQPTDHEVEVHASRNARFGSLVGRSVAMRELFWQLDAAAGSDIAVLIEGETGVGKERVAESLHRSSSRASGPFVVLDCGALVANLVEAELFGHLRGAFTGADEDRPGLLEQADGGTLFLDEIGELPLPLQVKLLGAIERKRTQRIGGGPMRAFDVRVVAATNRDLARAVNQGSFRADLFYRLAVLRVRVPPLRDRLEDLPVLVDALLGDLRARHGESVPATLSSLTVARLQAQPWPGNVRELRGAIERAVLGLVEPSGPPPEPGFLSARAEARARFERAYFTELLKRSDGNVSEAARVSRLDRRYLIRLLDRLDLRPR